MTSLHNKNKDAKVRAKKRPTIAEALATNRRQRAKTKQLKEMHKPKKALGSGPTKKPKKTKSLWDYISG